MSTVLLLTQWMRTRSPLLKCLRKRFTSSQPLNRSKAKKMLMLKVKRESPHLLWRRINKLMFHGKTTDWLIQSRLLESNREIIWMIVRTKTQGRKVTLNQTDNRMKWIKIIKVQTVTMAFICTIDLCQLYKSRSQILKTVKRWGIILSSAAFTVLWRILSCHSELFI